MASIQYADLLCPVCQRTLRIDLARGRASGKPFVMLACPQDGRHFRAFINDRDYVAGVIERLEDSQGTAGSSTAPKHPSASSRRSKTNLERGGGP